MPREIAIENLVKAEDAITELRGVGLVFRELGFASASDEWTPQKDVWKEFAFLAGSIDRLCNELTDSLWPAGDPDGRP